MTSMANDSQIRVVDRAARWAGRLGLPAFMLGGLLACPSEPKPSEPPLPPPVAAAPKPAEPVANAVDDQKAAVEIFSTRCVPCHGPKGGGDGPASAGLTPKPASFSSPEWQAKVTDEHIEKIVVYGGAAVGKSPAMPPNPDLDMKPGVVKALRAYLRTLKQ
ncbi:MAG: cytochrome c [Deltaproteobacteria bacterium]|nr:cytochrome c [Deltaproteobacteria bacterium]